MSNIEQLFTDLTSEQASVVEGGATLHIQFIKAIKADADPICQVEW